LWLRQRGTPLDNRTAKILRWRRCPHEVKLNNKARVFKEEEMAEVRIEHGESFERALKKFSAQVKREGIVKNCRERQYYTKPSQKRRLKRNKKK
jgi:small subunit ribosomal protein S21